MVNQYTWIGIIVGLFFIFLASSLLNNQVFAEEKVVLIPFGAYNPELNTPAEVWYDPPEISIQVGDTITWKASAITGNCIAAHGYLLNNASGTATLTNVDDLSNDIIIEANDATANTDIDLTTSVDTGFLEVMICYITDA